MTLNHPESQEKSTKTLHPLKLTQPTSQVADTAELQTAESQMKLLYNDQKVQKQLVQRSYSNKMFKNF